MEYIKAVTEDTEQIYELVQNTIKTVYPKYYPKEVVDFFCEHHNKENILRDIELGVVGVLIEDGAMVGTGCYQDNHITRVYVLSEFQGRGYGSFIMQQLEDVIAKTYDSVFLDASLPAAHLYEKRGYQTIRHERWNVENGVVLVYEIMEKQFAKVTTDISYEGRVFVPKMNTENGEVDGQTEFFYHQRGNLLWADYSGGEIIKGYLLGSVDVNGELDFYYQHMNIQNQMRVGKCHSIPHVSDNGKIELEEQWQWLNGDESKGNSVLEENYYVNGET